MSNRKLTPTGSPVLELKQTVVEVVECGCQNGKVIYDGDMGEEYERKCPACHGTGTREVQKVVRVEQIIISPVEREWIRAWTIHDGRTILDVTVKIDHFSSNPEKCFGSETVKKELMKEVRTRLYNGETIPGVMVTEVPE